MATKEKILSILNEKKDGVSGEILAAECGVSRAAVWKAIDALRKEGFLIEGTTNFGYKICGEKDVFSKSAFESVFFATFPEFSDSHIECFKVIDSTSNYAKRILSECGNLRDSNENLTVAGKKYHNSIFVAESQTAGRGRLGRSFVSPEKTGIYLSVIYAPEGGIVAPERLTAFSAVAVCRALKKLYDIEAQIKWVNDVFYKGKKIVGILTEGVVNFETKKIESAVVGIGINLFDNFDISDDLKKVVGSVFGDDQSADATRCKTAAQIAGETLSIFSENPAEVIKEYKAKSFLIGKNVVVHPIIGDDRSAYAAKVLDIDDKAALVVELIENNRQESERGEIKNREIEKNDENAKIAKSDFQKSCESEIRRNESGGKIRILNSGEVSIKSESVAE